MNRNAVNLRPSGQRRSYPLEVYVPQVHAWIEESSECPRAWCCSGDVRPFVPVAVKTSVGEILENSLAPMLTCNDMVDVKRQT
jgi:hypothetical protein